MIRMSENRNEHWTPRKRDIEQAKTACACPPDVLISKLPRDANLITGTGIRDGALVLSPSHLKYIRFPLHPLFHVVLSALDIHPMQLSPNSYLQLSAFLALGLQVGATIDCSDFFHFHDCILIREEVDYFHFASKPNCRTFVNKPSSHKNWKHRPLLITGNWAAPELNCLKIRSTFAASAANFTTSPSPERIQWLKAHLAGGCWDIREFSTRAILDQISQERTSFIYHLFRPKNLKLKLKRGLEGKELTTYIVESLANMDAGFSPSPEHVAARERMRKRVEERNKSGETYSLPSKSKTKRSESSASGINKRLKTVSDQSAHSSGTCFEPISSPTYPLLNSIPLNKEKNAALVPDDASAFQNAAPQEIMKAVDSHLIDFRQMAKAMETRLIQTEQNNEIKDKQLEKLKLELNGERQRANELEGQLQKVEAERDALNVDLIKVKSELAKTEKEVKNVGDAGEPEFQKAKKKIVIESACNFRFGWDEALLPPNGRIFPIALYTQLGLEPGDDDSENADDQESENEPEDEDDRDDEDEDDRVEEDEDDRDDEDFNDPGRAVENSLGRIDVDNNLNFSMHPQNSSMTHVVTSPNKTHPPQSNQETSNTKLNLLRSGETDEEAVHSFEDPDRVDLDQIEPTTMVRDLPDMTYSLPSKPSKLKTKRSGSSALGVKKRLKTVSDQSAHSSRTCLEPISSPTYPPLKWIPLNKEKNAALVPNLSTDVVSGHSSNCWIPKFKKDDGTFVTEEEKLVGNPEACLAVWRGLFHPADASAFQKAAPQEIMKSMNSRFIELGQMALAIETMVTQTGQNNENKGKQLEELKLELNRERQRANELEGQLQKVEAKRVKTEKEFKNEKDDRELEFQKAKKKIVVESARYFRFGWFQARFLPNERIVASPDVLDTKLGLQPRGYQFFFGMKPADRCVEDDSESANDQENVNEQEDEDDRDGKDDHDQDDHDFNVPDHPVDNNQDVKNSLGRRGVGNNLDLSMHDLFYVHTPLVHTPPNVETSPPLLHIDNNLDLFYVHSPLYW